MNNTDNISKIAEAVANANANGNAVSSRFSGLLEELRSESFAEQNELTHGLPEPSINDIQEEIDGWKPSEEIDFDSDENLVDMDIVSGSFRDIFND